MPKVKIKPDLERNELTRYLGKKRGARLSYYVQTKIIESSTIASKLIKPVVYYEKKGLIHTKKGALVLEGGISFKTQKILKVMRSCEEVVCFIGTIGDGIERETHKLFEGNRLSEAYILDAMGSVAVESMVDKFHKAFITRNGMDGKGVTLRFSPGYCDWPIGDQKKIFSIFDLNHLEVELTDSCFMRPRKSVSGIFGITPFHLDPELYPYNPCLECPKRDCAMRRS